MFLCRTYVKWEFVREFVLSNGGMSSGDLSEVNFLKVLLISISFYIDRISPSWVFPLSCISLPLLYNTLSPASASHFLFLPSLYPLKDNRFSLQAFVLMLQLIDRLVCHCRVFIYSL